MAYPLWIAFMITHAFALIHLSFRMGMTFIDTSFFSFFLAAVVKVYLYVGYEPHIDKYMYQIHMENMLCEYT